MAAVLRVKRRCDEERLEAFVLACKRRKTNDEVASEENHLTAIVQFAGTVETQHEDVVPHINHLRKEDLKTSWKKHNENLAAKLRAEKKETSSGNRYKVVNYFRHLQETETLQVAEGSRQDGKDGDSEVLTVVDIVSASKEDGKNDTDQKSVDKTVDEGNEESKEDISYVYDLYYGKTDDFMVLDHLVDIHPLPHPVDFSSLRTPGEDDDSADDIEDEDDSNDENNWRNDYPDSDHSMNEDDTRLALEMGGIQIDDGGGGGGSDGGDDKNELSSDEEEERYLYDVDADPLDIELYGESYARYKYQRKKELYADERNSSDEERGYGDDSDDDYDYDDVKADLGDDDNEDPELRFM